MYICMLNRTIMKLYRHILLAVALLGTLSAYSQDGFFIHTVSKGQTMYSIAKMYGVTQDTIINMNPGSEIMIRIGQSLRIPQISESKETGNQVYHTIMSGETLYRLSINYKVPIKDICDANPGLSADNFRAGQVILIPVEKKQEAQNGKSQTLMAVQQTQLAEAKELKDTLAYRTVHTVKAKETVSKICRLYDISQSELLAVNPELKGNSKLSIGQKLNIPFSSQELKEKKNSLEKVDQKLSSMDNRDVINAGHYALMTDIPDMVHISLLLPFELEDSISEDRKKMVEFYQGVLLALDTLKSQGVSVELNVFDTGNDTTDIAHILEDPAFGRSNLIIGPKYPIHIKAVAEYARENKIITVLPMTSDVEQVYNNPYLFQLNTPQSFWQSKIYDNFIDTFCTEDSTQVIILNLPADSVDNDFTYNLKPVLERRQIPYLTMVIDTPVYRFNDTLITDTNNIERKMNNVFVINSSKEGPLTTFLPMLQIVNRNKHPFTETVLFGYREYQAYARNNLIDQFHEANIYFYSWFYSDLQAGRTLDFHDKFRRSFMKQIMISFPSYAMYGYDVANWFVKAFKLYGNQLGLHSKDVDYNPLHVGFNFERISPWGGMINNKVFFIHYGKDYTIETIDFDKK